MIDLRQGDCLEVMKDIPNKSIDCIITSPPYNLGGDFHICNKGKDGLRHRISMGGYNTFNDNLTEEEYQHEQIEYLNLCYEKLKDDKFMFYVHKDRIKNGTSISARKWIEQSKFNISQVVVLDYSATANVDKRRFFPVYELLFVLSKDNKSKLHNDECLTDVWKLPRTSRKKTGHPASFVLDIPTRCIMASTKENDVVLDTYMGVGTTGVACLNTNRNFIGIELDEKYFNIAKQRIEEVQDERND